MKSLPFLPVEDRYIRIYYPMGITSMMAARLNRKVASLHSRARMLGVRKKREVMVYIGRKLFTKDHPGRKHLFKKGNVPANKGKKMSPEQYAKSAPTMFKKGIMPDNHKPLWSFGTRNNFRRKTAYLYVKIGEPNRWRPVHRLIWEECYGPVMKGFNIVFKDNDSMNCQIGNLEMISDKDLMARNNIHVRYSEEVRNAIMLIGSLKRRISETEQKQARYG